MALRLSIIIPCYNCADTLKDAVTSCYTQDLALEDFEIILVDDGSSDNTRDVINEIVLTHKNCRAIFHDTNRGGGAARNTGIKHSTGRFIYCLDSDNLFAPHSVLPMLTHLETTDSDGAVFYERRFFFGNTITRYTTHINTIQGRSIVLHDLFTSDVLLDNFFFSRNAYDKTQGYPEHHGFDTQCFEARFLAAGNTANVVPGSIFYHRHGTNEPSYFERVHDAGLFSVNMMLILEEVLHLFSKEAIEELVQFPLFTKTRSDGENIRTLTATLAEQKALFATSPTPHRHQPLLNTLNLMRQEQYTDALTALIAWQNATGIKTPYTRFLFLRLGLLATQFPPAKHIAETFRITKEITPVPIVRPFASQRRRIRGNILIQWLLRHLK
jgi:hypothetical protein